MQLSRIASRESSNATSAESTRGGDETGGQVVCLILAAREPLPGRFVIQFQISYYILAIHASLFGGHLIEGSTCEESACVACLVEELVSEMKGTGLAMTYKEKLQQANREARAAVCGLVATIVVWAIAGFGVAQCDIVVFGTPLWIITGCLGTFVFAVLVSIWLACFVFKDVGLDDDDNEVAEAGEVHDEQ